MTELDTKQILLVSSDYTLIQQLRTLLTTVRLTTHVAYSHIDAVYTVGAETFDAVMVDANMAYHRSGDSTLLVLANQRDTVPFVGVTPDADFVDSIPLPENVSLCPMDDSLLLEKLSSILKVDLVVPAQVLPGTQPLVEQEPAAPASSPPPVIALPPPVNLSVTATLPEWSDEVQTLFDLSKSLTEVLDLSEVLNRVVEAARRLTNAEEGMILLPDEDGGQLYLRAKVGIDIEVARNFRIRTEDTLAGRVYGTGQPVLIGAQGPLKVKTEYLVNALLYVPINYEGRVIGVLGVNNKTTDVIFNARHQDLLQNLASFAAVAIENARNHEETLQRAKELQMLVEASQKLNSSLSLETTLPNICDQLMRVGNANSVSIYMWNRETNQLETLGRRLQAVWPQAQGPVIDLSRMARLQRSLDAQTGFAVRRADAPGTGEMELLTRYGLDTLQTVPIVGGETLLGVVLFYYIVPPERLLDIDTIHRIQVMTIELLAMLSSQGNQSKPKGVFRILDNVVQLAGAAWGEVAIAASDHQSLNVQVSSGTAVWLQPLQPMLDLNRFPDLVEAIEGQVVIVRSGDAKPTPGVRILLDQTQCRSVIGLPLIQRSKSQGMVLVGDTRRNRTFGQRDIDMARAVVAQAATALDNARLFHRLERSLIELKETQERLVQTARLSAMGELAAAVAHQINNPLTTIMVDSEMMLLDESPDSQNYQSLQAIHRAGKRASGVARRLLAISRPDDPEAPPERIDVVDTIQGVLSLVKGHIERDRIRILATLPEDPLPPVWAGQGQLDDIWLNLLLNAHDALMGREDGQIGISAAHNPGEEGVEVVVWDNGPGIPERIIQDIFKPFFTTKPPGEGTGLGLHICRQTAERVGGTISVSSVPGEGARFTVKLPINRGGILT